MAKRLATVKGLIEVEVTLVVKEGIPSTSLKNTITDTIRSALYDLQDIYGDPYTVEHESLAVEFENEETAR